MKKISVILCLLLVLSWILPGCSRSPEHSCGAVCDSCGLCLNPGCTESVCAGKCAGHHSCTEVCSQCGLCLNEACAETVCREKCQGHHTCLAACESCGLCLNGSCADPVCGEKCPGHSLPDSTFYPAGFVAGEPVSLDTGILVLDVEAGVWVPGHAQAVAQALADALEQVSGVAFAGTGTYANSFPDGKVHARFTRDLLYGGEDWYQGLATSEIGSAYASAWGHAELSPGDLFVTPHPGTAHELSHVLAYRQTEWSFCQLLCEGFAEYTAYLAQITLAETDPQLGYYAGDPRQSLWNMEIYDYPALYAQPVEYWFENTFSGSGNANYAIGFRFMAYLKDVYGSYSLWLTETETLYPFTANSNGTDVPEVSWQIDALKSAYGEDVLDNFYPWLKSHETEFAPPRQNMTRDLTALEALNLYPCFSAIASDTALTDFAYQDLYICLEPAKQYLGVYKGLDISALTLEASASTRMELYRSDGSFEEVQTRGPVSLEDISYIRLMGSGSLQYLKITGYDGCG